MDFENKSNAEIENEKIIQIDFRDIVSVANGIDEDGHPNSATSLAIYEIDNNGGLNVYQEISFSNAVTNIFFSGGCIVIQVDFPSSAQYESHRAVQIAADWMKKMNTEEYNNKLLSLVVIPLKLMGQIYLMFSDLVYFTMFHVSLNEKRLLMCFDNTATQTFETEDIDINAIQLKIAQELDDELRNLKNEALDIQEQIRKLQEYNPYEALIKEKYSSIDGQKDEKNEVFHRPGYRFDSEKEGVNANDKSEQDDM